MDVTLPADIYGEILTLTQVEWRGVVTESLRVLDLVMRDEIRPAQLAETRRSAQRLVSHTLSPAQYDVVMALVQALVVPNSSYDAEQTTANRRETQSAVAPVHWVIREGESVLREGEIVTPLALEKLQMLGLRDEGLDWQDFVSSSLVYLVMVVATSLYVWRSNSRLLERPRREWLLLLVLVIVGISARLVVPGRTLVPYLFPAAAAAMVVALLLDVQLAMIVSVISALLVALNSNQGIELAVYMLLGSLISALIVWRMDQLGAFVRAMVYLALTNASVLVGLRLGSQNYDVVGLVQLMGAGVLNAMLSCSLAFVAFSFIGRAFGITTSLQLLELARPTHPLFRQLLIKAPGTYHHSIVVSNMAERAAEAIGADALLARVGSYYHDIGKTSRPYFFAENQSDGENPHDQAGPQDQRRDRHRAMHGGHGSGAQIPPARPVVTLSPSTTAPRLVTYFLPPGHPGERRQRGREEDFRYPGPKPQSKETAIVMLADSIEAWVRANRPATQAEMERVIRQVINDRLVSGQLDEWDLTLKDLDTIREAFISVLQGIFHPRIQYPERSMRRETRRSNRAVPPEECHCASDDHWRDPPKAP